ncbi:hypothetical protein [Oryza sativa Japonica Group]|uniref:Uncharacterized protein B1096D03.25 n=1 Tax=Oryza sativa subsp. japonica TaxID=39947 RepID=Q5VPZ1_ORYSJ|nr:hypothetical protein [Oryza sativa Japonica Group]
MGAGATHLGFNRTHGSADAAMKNRILGLFKKGSSSRSSHHQDESSTHSSTGVSMEEVDATLRLLDNSNLDHIGDREMQVCHMIKDRTFAHTQAYDPNLIQKIGMDVDFHNVW